jgi:hypothetical protein
MVWAMVWVVVLGEILGSRFAGELVSFLMAQGLCLVRRLRFSWVADAHKKTAVSKLIETAA